MSLKPKKRFDSWPALSTKERREETRRVVLKRGKYVSQWTVAERGAGLGQMVGLAADAKAKRYMKRKGTTYELIEMYDTKEHAYDDARDWRQFPRVKVIVLPFGKNFLWGLYVHEEEI